MRLESFIREKYIVEQAVTNISALTPEHVCADVCGLLCGFVTFELSGLGTAWETMN